jgi:hypothetical protein
MLSPDERRELREMAASVSVRRDFRRLKVASRPDRSRPIELGELLRFLTAMNRLSDQPSRPRLLTLYSRSLL